MEIFDALVSQMYHFLRNCSSWAFIEHGESSPSTRVLVTGIYDHFRLAESMLALPHVTFAKEEGSNANNIATFGLLNLFY